MKFKYILENLENNVTKKYKTLQSIAEDLQIKYHTARSILLCDEKQFLHPGIKDLCSKYKIYSNPDI